MALLQVFAAVAGALVVLGSASPPKRVRGLWLLAPFRVAVSRAGQTLGVEPPPVFAVPGLKNATASSRAIKFGPEWLDERLERLCVDAWCRDDIVACIAAHEVAHVALGHRGEHDLVESRRQELEADIVAGWVAAQLGVGTEGFRSFLAIAANVCSTHPRWPSRFVAMQIGIEGATAPLDQLLAGYEAWVRHEAVACGPGPSA
jgi:hypothetical protein